MYNYWRKPGGGRNGESNMTRKFWTIAVVSLFIVCFASVADARVVADQGQPEIAGNGNGNGNGNQGDKPGNGNQGDKPGNGNQGDKPGNGNQGDSNNLQQSGVGISRNIWREINQ